MGHTVAMVTYCARCDEGWCYFDYDDDDDDHGDVVLDLFQAYSSRSFVELSDSEDDDNDSLLSLQELRWEPLQLYWTIFTHSIIP